METKNYMNFAKRLVMVLAIVLMAGNMWGTDQTYNLVSDYSSLSNTDKILIVAYDGSSKYYALKNNQQTSASNLPTTEVSITSNTITADLETDYTWCPEYDAEVTISSTKYRSYYFKSTKGNWYLYNAGATSSFINTKSLTDAQNKWVLGYTGVNGDNSCRGLWSVSANRMLSLFISTTNPVTYTFRAYGSSNFGNINGHTVYIYRLQNGDAITLNANTTDEGSSAGAGSIPADATSMTIGTTPVRPGYHVEGYYTAASEGTKIAAANGALQAGVTVDAKTWTDNTSKWKKGGDATFYTYWTANTYQVAFDANGGSGTMSNEDFTYAAEAKALTANAFTAPQHKYFIGWSEDENATVATYADKASVRNLTTENNGTVTLYAIWANHTYTNYRTKCCTPLDAPENIEVSVTGAETATVTWDAVTDATGYEYKLGDGDWTDTEIAGNAASPELSLTGLTGASNYTIYVRTNGNGDNCTEGTASAGTNFRTHSTISAAENDALMGTAKVSLNNSNWYDAVEAADGTKIYLQATAASDSYEFSSWATPTSGSISDNELTGWSGDVTVTANFVTKELTKLATPTGMGLVGDPAATSATIKWNAVDHASSYTVVCAGATQGDISITDGVASCPLTSLTANTTYNWTVQAIGDGVSYKNGDACASQSFTTDKKKPTAISITTAPTKTIYLEGEDFDATGLVVSVTYNNGELDDVYTSITPSTNLAAGTTKVTISATLNETTVSVDQAITVRKKYVLTFLNNGVEISHKDLYEGAAYGDFPSNPVSGCHATSTTFMGWTTEELIATQATAPAYAKTTDVMPAADVELNAVWAKKSGHEGYDLVSSLTANKKYIFVSSNTAGSAYAISATGISTSTSNGVKAPATSVSISSGTPVYISTLNENLEFAYDGTDFQIVGTLASDIDKKYLYINGSGISRRTEKRAYWDNNNGVYGRTNNTPYTYHYLYLNGTDFDRTTSPTSTNRVYAFEKQETTYADYITTCCTDWSESAPAISYSTPAHWKAGDDDVAVTIASGTTYGDVSFESSDEAVLTVDSDGKIHAVSMGTATVTATWAGGVVLGTRYCPASSTSATITVSGTITVTFNGNGSTSGSMSDQVMYYNEATALNANAFSKDGHSFAGWAETSTGSKKYNDKESVTLTADVELFACWTINSHSVTLNQPTGNTIEATGAADLANVEYGTEITLTATENDGYVFTGWSVTGATVADASAKSTTFTMPDNDVTVTATYSTYSWIAADPRYSVTTAPKISYTRVEKFSTSGVVIKENFKRSDDNTITKQEDYEGAWTAKLNGVAIANDDALSLDDNGKTLKLYIGETEIASYTLTIEDVDVDQFIDGLWGETFDVKTGTYDMPTPTSHDAGSTDCQKHNTFAGWILAANAENPTVENIITGEAATGVTAANNIYYAVWSKSENVNKEFTVSKSSFSNSENTGASINTDVSYTTAQNGGTIAPAITSGGALRLYQRGSNASYGGSITIKAAENMTLKKVDLTTAGDEYKYVAADHSTSPTGLSSELNVSNGHIVVSSLSGRYLSIYNTSTSNSDRIDITKIEVTYEKEVTEVDYITDCDPRYDVEFLAGTGATGSYDNITKKAGVEITLPDGSALSKDHHTFDKWYSVSYGTYFAGGASYTVPVDGDILEAQWTEDHHAFVTFKNGENVIGDPLKVYDGGSYDLLGAQTAEGKAFIGWKWNGNKYKAGQTSQHMDTPAEDRTYIAVWMPIIDVSTLASEDLSDSEWVLVENKNQLKAGDFIIIAAAEYDVALSNYQKTNNRDDADVTKAEDKLTFTSNVAPLFLQYDPENDYYAFYDRAYATTSGGATNNSGYLYSDNNLKTQAGIDGFQSVWSINIVNKKASIIAQGNNNKTIMLYNPASNAMLFACYESVSQKELAIYKLSKIVKPEGTVNASDVLPEVTYNIDLTLEGSTKIVMDVEREVNDFTISAEEGQSTQIMNPTNLKVKGEYHYDLTLNTTGTMDNSKWYSFAVPFPVDAATGIQRLSDKNVASPAGFNSHYVLIKYNSALRALTGNGWEYVTAGETLEPGKFYMIALNSNAYNRVRMIKKEGAYTIPYSVALTTTGGSATDANWNAIANTAWSYANASSTGDNAGLKVMTYNATTNTYDEFEFGDVTLTVGTPFFVQAASTGSINFAVDQDNHETVKAPKREIAEDGEFQVRLGANTESYYDKLYLSATEEAKDEYQIGHDLLKMGVSSEVAQMYVPAYGTKLCDAEFPSVNNQATFPVTFVSPMETNYMLYIERAPENANLYLLREGNIVWDLTQSAYEVELPKGTTTEYSLLLVKKAPQVVTGLGGTDATEVGAQKIIIDENVYILRGEKLYDVTGKAVK